MGNNERKVVLLLSGGIDSTVLFYWLEHRDYEIYPLHINYGQNSLNGEIDAIKSILSEKYIKKTRWLDVHGINEIGSGSLIGEYPNQLCNHQEWFSKEYFPNRNIILLILAAAYGFKLDIPQVAIGLCEMDSYWDTKKQFIEQVENILISGLSNFKIIAPFIEKPRKIVIQEAITLRVPLELTFSCNAMGNKPCLLCTSCVAHEQALELYKHVLLKTD